MTIRKIIFAIVVSALCALPVHAKDDGPWVGRANNGGEVVNVETGQVVITGGGEKAAEKVAKKLNKAYRKEKKKQSNNGVYDDGSGACNDPRFNC